MNPDQSIDPALVKEELSRILKTPHFRSSKILSSFLRFVVTETLAGNKQSLKEYVIGTEVLKKGADFNPQLDAIVRIHARRLRKLLEEYYDIRGVNDPIKIFMPTGRYVPYFESNNNHSKKVNIDINDQKHGTHLPRIAIVPLTKSDSDERLIIICASICRDLSIELSRYQEINVISNYSVKMAQNHPNGIEEIITRLQPDYLIFTTCYLISGDFNSSIELHSVKKNQLIWADTYIIEDFERNALSNYRGIIKNVVSNISGFIGIIFQDLFSENSIPVDFDTMYAIYWHNKFHSQFSLQAYYEVTRAIDIGLKNNPDNSLLHSIKAELVLNQRTMKTDFEIDPLNDGINHAIKAIGLDHCNQHGWEMLAWAYIMKHDKNKSIEAIEKCLSLNPSNTMYQSTLGFGYICIGEYEKGWDLLSNAVKSPYYFWVANIGLCLYQLRLQNFEDAYYWANSISRSNFLWDPLLRTCCAGHLNFEAIAESKQELFDLLPDFNEKGRKLINTFLFDSELQKTIIKGLQKAGLHID